VHLLDSGQTKFAASAPAGGVKLSDAATLKWVDDLAWMAQGDVPMLGFRGTLITPLPVPRTL